MNRRSFLKGLFWFSTAVVLAPKFVLPEPKQETDPIVLGYRGRTAFDAGVVYCPYIPLQVIS